MDKFVNFIFIKNLYDLRVSKLIAVKFNSSQVIIRACHTFLFLFFSEGVGPAIKLVREGVLK